ncbi:MAG: ImmA/IrrE family metallo-endopeptidase [Alphaproteobacteria bacterium PRO2]|nr:ImmA/IrrE family metallo-endopeptidase [Alphaproteobacteria bacterium PRO2]
MGKEIKLPTTPEGWAIHLSNVLKTFQTIHGLDRFPVDVAAIAREYSKQVFPDEPITLVQGEAMSKNFEGMLLPNPKKKGEWGIFYNNAISSKGRQNYTLGHELGHYLLHRHKSPEGIQCSERNMLDWKSEHAQMEAQANTFSSSLLMPRDDFRTQINGHKGSMEMMQHLSERYGVSITAAILKWLEITDQRAMIVIGKNGFIDWARSSERLLKSGVFYRARQETIELPAQSLAARQNMTLDNLKGIKHAKGVWNANEEVQEMTIFADQHEMTISLLLYPKDAPNKVYEEDEGDGLEDTYTRFTKSSGH